MATYTRQLLSGSTSGLPIKVTQVAIASGDLIHTAIAGAVPAFDEVYLLVSNTDTIAHTLTIGWGGTTNPDHLVCAAVSIPPNSGPTPMVLGLPLNGAMVVRAAADVANKLLITGYVNRSQ